MTSSSCFDCVFLGNHKNAKLRDSYFRCTKYGHTMSYDEARKPNLCLGKEQYERDTSVVEVPQFYSKVVSNLHKACIELAEYLGRPFTLRELSDRVPYTSRNSLWMLMEQLVKTGVVTKSEATIQNNRRTSFAGNVYYPKKWRRGGKKRHLEACT